MSSRWVFIITVIITFAAGILTINYTAKNTRTYEGLPSVSDINKVENIYRELAVRVEKLEHKPEFPADIVNRIDKLEKKPDPSIDTASHLNALEDRLKDITIRLEKLEQKPDIPFITLANRLKDLEKQADALTKREYLFSVKPFK